MNYFNDVSIEKQIIIPEIHIGEISTVVSPLNAKNLAMKLLYAMDHLLRLI